MKLLALAFEFRHFGQTASKSLRAGESRAEKCLQQFPGKGVSHHEASKANDVHIVILNALMGGKILVNQARADPGYFVRADRGAHSATANCYAPGHPPGGDHAGERHYKIGIVIIFFRKAITEIDYFMPRSTQFPGQIFLQVVTTVVGSDADGRA
jgi:hypothetical protein